MRMKKMLSAFCAAAFALSAAGGLPAAEPSAYAEEMTIGESGETQESSFTYKENSTGITITGYEGTGGDVTIPSKIDGKKVTEIGDGAFLLTLYLTSVTIPDGVTEIGDEAFCACLDLTSITIPDSVTEIGDEAFGSCTSLTSVTIPDSVTEIGGGAFYACTSLTSIFVNTNNSSYTSDSGVLYSKDGKTLHTYPAGKKGDFTIPDGVTKIGDEAFRYCPSLTSITIPDSVKVIGDGAFRHCLSLTSVTIPDSVTEIGSEAFCYCENLTSVTIPDSVTRIGDNAFGGCTNLTIYGYTGSTAETYADENIIPFVTLSFAAPTNVYVDENDVIHWDAVEEATGYRIRLENKEGDYKILNADTNYLENWKSKLGTWDFIYTRNHVFTVSVAAVDTSNKMSEYSEPVEFTYSMKSWKANFKYDEETGDLSWDNWTDDVSNGNISYHLWGIPIPNRWTTPPSAVASDSGYWNPTRSGYTPASVTLPLEFAYRSLAYPDTDFRGDHTLWLTSCALGSAEEWWTDKIGDYESADTFTYSYDGCDVNPALKPPKDNLWQGGGLMNDWTDYITAAWDPVDGAVGYIVHFTCEAGKWNANTYISAYSNSLRYFWYSGLSSPDGAWCLEICSVDKNGDRSEWSEPLSFTVKDGKVVDGLAYAYLNNIDSEGNLLLTEAEGAVRYTVGVTGNGADLSFESETPVIEGFSEALKGYPAGEYTIVISTYNNIGICRWLVGSFNKQDEGFFNEENETGSAIESAPEAAGIPESDKIPAVAINPAFNLIKKGETDVFFNISNIKIKAQEIYDEAGLKRAEEALGEEIIGNKHYNLLDLTLWEGDTDISNDYEGLVKVTIPLPTGHLGKTFHVYRFIETDGKWGYEEIPGEQTEDSYIIYLEHFSKYALVADGGETDDHNHTFSAEWKSDGASHWHECACGEKSDLSAHTLGEWIANAAAGYRHRDCTVCGAVLETVSLSGGNPSVGRPSVNPAPSAGTVSSNNSDHANDPKDEEEPEPSEADEEEPEPSEADGEDDVDEIGGESDDDADEDEFDDDVDEDSDDSAEDDSYGDTASKDDTQAASNEVSAADMIARDENPSTGAGFGGTVFVFLGAGAAALAASKKGRKRADR